MCTRGDLCCCCPVCDLEYLWKYVDRYVSHFLDARFWFGRPSLVIMFWFILVAKSRIIGCILNASIQFAREAKFQTRSGEIVSKLKSEEVDFGIEKFHKN